jgi:hypothetical protein
MSDSTDLSAAVYSRFTAVNGEHPMTPADDAYVTKHFITLDDLCSAHGETPDEVRRRMLAGQLPLPGYIRSDGTEMVPPDYFDLADQAGGIEALPGWFQGHWSDRQHAAEEWRSYLNGHYVCLHDVTPLTMRRKDELTAAIKNALAEPEPDSAGWLSRLHQRVDELDELMLEFADYDRLRVGGPVSRDIFIDDVRAKYPRSTYRP